MKKAIKYEILEKKNEPGIFGRRYLTKFQCDKGVFWASEAMDPISSEVAILNDTDIVGEDYIVGDPIRRISTKEAIEKWCRGEWDK